MICPITQELINDPVIGPSGNNYERDAIVKWLETNQSSPLTREPLSPDQLYPNKILKSYRRCQRNLMSVSISQMIYFLEKIDCDIDYEEMSILPMNSVTLSSLVQQLKKAILNNLNNNYVLGAIGLLDEVGWDASSIVYMLDTLDRLFTLCCNNTILEQNNTIPKVTSMLEKYHHYLRGKNYDKYCRISCEQHCNDVITLLYEHCPEEFMESVNIVALIEQAIDCENLELLVYMYDNMDIVGHVCLMKRYDLMKDVCNRLRLTVEI